MKSIYDKNEWTSKEMQQYKLVILGKCSIIVATSLLFTNSHKIISPTQVVRSAKIMNGLRSSSSCIQLLLIFLFSVIIAIWNTRVNPFEGSTQ